MMLFEFFSFLSDVLPMCSVPSFSTAFINEVFIWWALAIYRGKFAFLSVVLPLTDQNPLSLSVLLLCQHFPLEIFLFFASLLSFSIWNTDHVEKITLLFQVANSSAIAFKIYFIFPYILENVRGRFKLLAKDDEKDSTFVILIYK